MFERLDPRQGKRLEILREDGTLAPEAGEWPAMPPERLLEAHRAMVTAREMDEWCVSLNRQGRMPTYPPVRGQEANSAGAILALRPDDWFSPAFRELPAFLLRGIPIRQQYLFWLGVEEGSRLPAERYRMTPISVPIGSQTLHAVGLAHAERYKGTDRIAICFCGDGGTSEGEFLEALNFAGAWNAPVIFYVQNNGFAISVPRRMQTRAATLAERAFGFGFPGVQVDGNDVMAVHAAVSLAAERARAGGGPTLIEGITYRMGAHTTADDPTRYRSDDEVKAWEGRDPILRLERHLAATGLLPAERAARIRKEARDLVRAEFEIAEAFRPIELEETFKYLYAEMPPVIRHQMEERARLAKEAAR